MWLGWSIVRIVGRSMEPILENGDYAVARRANGGWHQGDIVLVEHGRLGRIVKCLGSGQEGRYEIWSPGPDAPDSSELGSVGLENILGRLVFRIFPGGIRRLSAVAYDRHKRIRKGHRIRVG